MNTSKVALQTKVTMMTNFTKPVAIKISFVEHAYENIEDEVRTIVNEFLLNHLKEGEAPALRRSRALFFAEPLSKEKPR